MVFLARRSGALPHRSSWQSPVLQRLLGESRMASHGPLLWKVGITTRVRLAN